MSRRAAAAIDDARRALEHFENLRATHVAPLGRGLINDTFAVDGPDGAVVLQRVHPVFPPEVHRNIEAVTAHLATKGMTTPRLRLAADGRPWAELDDGSIWRVMTRIEGATFDAPRSPEQVRSAASMLARFHSALDDLEHDFVGMRTGVHDTPEHLRNLEQALQRHRAHRLFDRVARLAEAILAGADTLPQLGSLPDRIVHGDPKLNNVLFAAADGPEADRAVCLVDLDTVGPMPLPLELGDAWRSWCNPRGEDESAARFDMQIYEDSLRGYADASTLVLQPAERAGLVHGVEWITLELAARFAADALTESYFGWDSARFATAGDHNLTRATGQWSLHRTVLAQRTQRATLLTTILS